MVRTEGVNSGLGVGVSSEKRAVLNSSIIIIIDIDVIYVIRCHL